MGPDRHSRLMLIALLLVAAAILARAAIPLGWMPMQTEHGLRMMPCPSQVPIAVAQPEIGHAAHGAGSLHRMEHGAGSSHGKGHHSDSSHDEVPRDPCPFGVTLGKALDLPVPLALAAMPAIAALDIAPQSVTARLVAARGLRPPARGPPVIV